MQAAPAQRMDGELGRGSGGDGGTGHLGGGRQHQLSKWMVSWVGEGDAGCPEACREHMQQSSRVDL